MTTLTALQRTFFQIRPEHLCNGCFVDVQTMPEGMVDIIGFNLAPISNRYDTTVSSSSWELLSGAAVALSGATSGNITTQVTVTANSEGPARLKNTITMSDGQVIIRFVDVTVIKSSIEKDYPSY